MEATGVPGAILTEGPRHLPPDGWVGVWIDTGAGPGYTRQVPTEHLKLAPMDDGKGRRAIYHYSPAGWPDQERECKS